MRMALVSLGLSTDQAAIRQAMAARRLLLTPCDCRLTAAATEPRLRPALIPVWDLAPPPAAAQLVCDPAP